MSFHSEHSKKDLEGTADIAVLNEKQESILTETVRRDDRYHFDTSDLDRVQRRLEARHIQMIAIAGTIGTGLFLGSGEALSHAGPLGAFIAYALVGTVAYATLCSVGEMTSFAPISGTFPHFAARWVDPALGFSLGWNYFYGSAISVATEISAAQILLTFWDSNTKHVPIYVAIITVATCLINIFGTKIFGESEFVFASIKLILITGLIIVGLIIDLGGVSGQDRIGFRYWDNPGAIARAGLSSHLGVDRFLAILSVIIQAAFSYGGMELVVVASSETASPRRNISKALPRVFFRICIFYILGILITGMIVPYNDPSLLQLTGTSAQSPYVIAITRAGIKVLPSIVNAAIFTSAFSAGNSFLFVASRVLYGLALRGQAPRIFTWCTKKRGIPLASVALSCAFAFLSFMTVGAGANTVFNWLVNLNTVGGFFGWCSMNLTYIFFYRGLKAQGFDRKKIMYHNRFQPYLAYWGCFSTAIFILINGFESFWNFNVSDFLSAYLNIPIFFGLYFGYKIVKRTKIWKPEDMDFTTGIPTPEETETPEVPPRTILGKIASVLF